MMPCGHCNPSDTTDLAIHKEETMANEIFTLEALNAKHGDALLLHVLKSKRR